MNTISLLTPIDLSAAFLIEKQCHDYPWTEKTFYSNQGERYLNLKLSVGDTLAGFAITQVVMDEATLFNIAISPDFQRCGYGEALLKYLIDALRDRDVVTLWLEVRASNLKAISLYEKMAFNQVTVRKNYYPANGGREDAVIMALML